MMIVPVILRAIFFPSTLCWELAKQNHCATKLQANTENEATIIRVFMINISARYLKRFLLRGGWGVEISTPSDLLVSYDT